VIASNTIPLQRTDEGTWWPAEEGSALSETADEGTEFVVEPELRKVKKRCLRKDRELDKLPIGKALEFIADDTEEVSLAFSLKYQTATGEEQEMKIDVFREKISRLEDVGWTLYDAQEADIGEFEEVKAKSY
jgi:hypothetical protein